MTTVTTPEDAIKAAASIARDVADGKLSPAELERQAVAELRELVGQVIGPGDPVWSLQVEIARGVLAAGGIPADELSEWRAVERQRVGEQSTLSEPPDPLSLPDPDQAPPKPGLPASGPLSRGHAAADAEPKGSADVEAEPAAEPETPVAEPVAVIPPRPADGEYDPLRGWAAARRGFLT